MDNQINSFVDTIHELEKENAELKLRLDAINNELAAFKEYTRTYMGLYEWEGFIKYFEAKLPVPVMCCDSFKEFIPQFGWFKTDNSICLAPYIQCGEKKMRINHCPSCGKYVRDIELPEDVLLSLIS